jgi:Bacteriophage lambda head decoration protein D
VGTNDSFEFDYIPAYTKPTHEYGTELGTAPYASQFMAPIVRELLKSYAAFTQRGVTLAGGQGILPTGCVLAMQTASQLYYAYNATASDGTQNALGVLRDARDTGTASGSGTGQLSTPCLGNLVIRGILDLTLVSGTDTTGLVTGGTGTGGGIGSSTTGVVTQLKARTDTVNGLFIF